MKSIFRILNPITILTMMIVMLKLQPMGFGETRLFVPDYRFGGSVDTQLLITNTSDRDSNIDLWAFLRNGKLLGQEQLQIKAHGTHSLTLSEAFGSQSDETTGWLAAVSNSDGIQMSYNLLGEHTESREAQQWPRRELALDMQGAGRRVVRLSNMSSVANQVTLRGDDEAGRLVGLRELSIGPFQQIEVPLDTFKEIPARINILAAAGVLAAVGDGATGKASQGVERPDDAQDMALIIDSSEPVGAYQIVLRFDPTLVHLSQADITGGVAAGFDSKPLAIGIDNAAGILHLASFQIGNSPQGRVDVAHIRVRPLRAAQLQFGMSVEEITDLQGNSRTDSTNGLRLVRIK